MVCRALRRTNPPRKAGTRDGRPLHALACTRRLRRVAKPLTQFQNAKARTHRDPNARQPPREPEQCRETSPMRTAAAVAETQGHALPRTPSLFLSRRSTTRRAGGRPRLSGKRRSRRRAASLSALASRCLPRSCASREIFPRNTKRANALVATKISCNQATIQQRPHGNTRRNPPNTDSHSLLQPSNARLPCMAPRGGGAAGRHARPPPAARRPPPTAAATAHTRGTGNSQSSRRPPHRTPCRHHLRTSSSHIVTGQMRTFARLRTSPK